MSVVSNSVQPHRRQPNRLLCPWDSPGKNTGMGCHFLLQCMKMKSESEVAQWCLTLRLLVTPWTAAYQAPPSVGFSRQEYWGRLPFPSPVHESESEVAQSWPTLRLLANPWTAAYQAPPSMQEYLHGKYFLQARVLEWGAIAFSADRSSLITGAIIISLRSASLQPLAILMVSNTRCCKFTSLTIQPVGSSNTKQCS